MKRFIFSLMALIVLLSFTACSENDNPTDTSIYGYSLDQFIPKAQIATITDPTASDTLDFRALYAYEIEATDGFSPRDSENAGYDLTWDKFSQGYVVPADGNRTWFNDSTLPGAFKVRNTTLFRVYRKVTVADSTGIMKEVQLKGLPIFPIENWNGETEDAIKLSDLVAEFSGYVTVTLEASDGYTRGYTAEEIADGYYLLESEVTTFPTLNDGMTGGQKKFKKLAKIQMGSEVSSTNHTYLLADHEKADVTFNLPTDLSNYVRTELVDY